MTKPFTMSDLDDLLESVKKPSKNTRMLNMLKKNLEHFQELKSAFVYLGSVSNVKIVEMAEQETKAVIEDVENN